ncbi:ADOP family duplicated permease [Terriglobus sp. 2YAB30_2]|uniref:ABC transporter permease n=1 Tax=Terriglobus sp. 2YAB30_2 TaxID=3233023 RepID=UPI003F9E3CD3
MALWKRVGNVFRADRLRSEIEEELEAHVAEAMEHGRSEAEARKALGNSLRQREASYALRVEGWLDALRADVAFSWRQIKRNKVTSSVAILSLALAMGACVGAFRLMDAMLWRALPIAHPERLYGLTKQGISFDGKWRSYNAWDSPAFLEMRKAVKQQADLVAISYAVREELTYSTEQELEKATVVHVSGNLFEVFGLHPQMGRLLTDADDVAQGKAPYAVLSDDYWRRRFQRDPGVIGNTFRFQNGVYEIVGIAQKGFTGTTPGTIADIFLPMAMHRGYGRANWTWFRTLVALHENQELTPVQDKLGAINYHLEETRLKGDAGLSAEIVKNLLNNEVVMLPASTGVSDFREEYRRALVTLGVLVTMVLLIACINVANLMTAQAAGRAREMALRVSIGAGRWRLVQLMLVEAGMMAVLSAAAGLILAWWSAPMVVLMIDRPDVPVQLMLPADARVIAFGIVLTFGVMLLFGLAPALRASWVKPVSILKGSDAPRARHRWMRGMLGVQVAFCFVVLFVAGLFVATFQRLSDQPLGFNADRLLLLETTGRQETEATAWASVVEHFRTIPGVESVASCSWPLLSESAWNDSIAISGGPFSSQLAYFLNISPEWLKTMRIDMTSGRDFHDGDFFPEVAIVNETFVRTFLGGGNAIGKVFEKRGENGGRDKVQVVGVVKDAVYSNTHDAMPPVAFIPFFFRPKPVSATDAPAGLVPHWTIVVKTVAQDPMAMATTLRREVSKARTDMHVVNIRTQEELRLAQVIRERLLAMLSIFFGAVALLLAAIGLYGVLHYTVVEKKKEIGIRLALGARAAHIVRQVSFGIVLVVGAGSAIGLVAGKAAARYVGSLLYGVKAENPFMLVLPLTAIALAVVFAAVPAVRRALKVDPVEMLRAE